MKRLAVVLGLLWALVWSAPVLGLTYGGNLLTGGSCLASSEYNATYACGKAVDGSTGTRWASSDFAIPAWWRYDFGPGVAVRVDRLGINLDSTEHADGLVLAGSQDGSAWTTLLTTNGANATGWQYFEFTNGTAYRLYRVTVNTVHAGTVASFSELSLDASVENATPAPTAAPATAGPTAAASMPPAVNPTPSPAPFTGDGPSRVTGYGGGVLPFTCPNAGPFGALSCRWGGPGGGLEQWYRAPTLTTLIPGQDYNIRGWSNDPGFISPLMKFTPGTTLSFGWQGCYSTATVAGTDGNCHSFAGDSNGGQVSGSQSVPMPVVNLAVFFYRTSTQAYNQPDRIDFAARPGYSGFGGYCPSGGFGPGGWGWCSGTVIVGPDEHYARFVVSSPGTRYGSPNGGSWDDRVYYADLGGGLGVGWSAGTVESVIAGQTCVAGVDEGCYGPPVPPGYVWPAGDPNTGLWVCGPLSGTCSGKPYISPVLVAQCSGGDGIFDAVGWLAFIACAIGQLPGAMINAGIFVLNGLIDIVFPGQIGNMVGDFIEDMSGRVPFSYVAGAVSQVSAFLASPGGADPSFSVSFPTILGIGGGTFVLPNFADALPAGMRGLMGGLIYFAGALLILRTILGGVGGGSGGD